MTLQKSNLEHLWKQITVKTYIFFAFVESLCSKVSGELFSLFSPQLTVQGRGCGIHGTVVASWTTGQQVKRSILRLRHDS